MSKSSVEVVTSVQKRKRWSPIEKKTLVEETYEPRELYKLQTKTNKGRRIMPKFYPQDEKLQLV